MKRFSLLIIVLLSFCLNASAQDTTSLPVELTYFNATEADGKIVLNWETASETNNDRFEVYEIVNGQKSWLGDVAGAGTTTNTNQYRFVVENPSSGLHYYQIKQVDFDWTETFSDIVAISYDIEDSSAISYADGKLKIKGVLASNLIRVKAFTTDGKMVANYRMTIQNEGESNEMEISGGVKNQIIFVSVQSGNDFLVKKIYL